MEADAMIFTRPQSLHADTSQRVHVSVSLGAWRRVAQQGKACCAKRVGVSDTAGASAAEWRLANWKMSLQCASEQCELLHCSGNSVRFCG